MVDNAYKYAELIVWLKERGHSEEEVNKIVAHVEEYDQKTGFLSQIDSIESDEFGIAGIIAQALAGKDHSDDD